MGQYDLWVRSGTITVLGAILRASSTVHRIYAPSTHPLPVITHLLDPYDSVYQHAEVTLISCNTHIRSLQYLSPKLSCIWNHPESDQYALPPFNKSVSRRSFRYVSIILVRGHLSRALMTLDSCNPYPMIRIKGFLMSFRII